MTEFIRDLYQHAEPGPHFGTHRKQLTRRLSQLPDDLKALWNIRDSQENMSFLRRADLSDRSIESPRQNIPILFHGCLTLPGSFQPCSAFRIFRHDPSWLSEPQSMPGYRWNPRSGAIMPRFMYLQMQLLTECNMSQESKTRGR
jgi:hypothetical protein